MTDQLTLPTQHTLGAPPGKSTAAPGWSSSNAQPGWVEAPGNAGHTSITGLLQNNWPVIFKVIKVKEKLKIERDTGYVAGTG